ncbi:hypothetical protein PPS11_17720 [Pseudomonas putida S11]|nr:hypothetical protein PPS11_17720 [Pseudomonas putida S11]
MAGWVEPAAQARLGVQAVLLAEQVRVAGDTEHLGQLFALFQQQAVTLGHPLWQAPVLRHGLAQLHDAHAKQFFLDMGGVFALVDNPQLPGIEQLGVGQRQRPEWRQEQQAAPVDFLPQPCQAACEQAAGLLRGVLADQLKLAQYRRDLFDGHCWQALEQLFAALQAQAVEGDFQAFGGLCQAGIGGVIGFAHHRQHQRRAILHQFGDIAQRAAVIVDGGHDPVVAVLRHGDANTFEQLYPGL